MWKGKIIECEECGEMFEMRSINSRHCSDKCMNRAADRKKELRRRKRLRQNGKIDYSISLTKLIKKYNSKCQICGGLINEQDYIEDSNGNFIVGESYPTIDHIIPVSKGGTHTWDNVQLAHHYCNSIKNDNIYSTVESNGQLRII